MIDLLEDLEQQLAFEEQRTLTREDEMNGWNVEYQAGYKDGLRQAIACLKLENGRGGRNTLMAGEDYKEE